MVGSGRLGTLLSRAPPHGFRQPRGCTGLLRVRSVALRSLPMKARFFKYWRYERTCWLKNAIVRSHASPAAASSYRGVVSLLNPCWVPGYR